jgi:CheY-like chemotaxis protein
MTNQPGRVMVADDEHHIRQFLRDLFTSEGHEVDVFATGTQLLDAVPTFRLISGHPITEPEGFFAFIKKPSNLPRVIERWRPRWTVDGVSAPDVALMLKTRFRPPC